MHGVVLSRNSQTGKTIKLETALSKVEISDIGLQHALVFLWQKIHIINMVLVHLEWFAEWLPWACSHPLLSKDAKLFWCSSPSQVSGSDALAWAGDRCVGVWSFTVHMPACVPWTLTPGLQKGCVWLPWAMPKLWSYQCCGQFIIWQNLQQLLQIRYLLPCISMVSLTSVMQVLMICQSMPQAVRKVPVC